MFVQASDDITLIRVDDGEMSEEQIAQIEQAASDASSALTTATQAKQEAENTSEALETLEADVINGKYINAENIVTQGLQAGTAAIKNAVAINIDAEDISAKVVQSETLKANYAHVTDGVIDNATIASLEADKITSGTLDADYVHIANLNGKDIINSAVVAKALSNVLAETILGVKVYYQGEEPTGTFNEGDLWYKTITEAENPYEDVLYQYDGNGWVLQDFDVSGGILRSNLITAQEIAANTITAGNILGGSLTIGCMDDTVASAQSEDKRGQMKWLNNALHIGSVTTDGKQYYETEIGGNGILFKYGSSEENAQTVASIDQDELKITKTIVFTEMKIGKWSWAINPINDHLTVKWGGED